MIAVSNRSILHIEDESWWRDVVAGVLKVTWGDWERYGAREGIRGREMFVEKKPSLVLLDLRLPDIDGLSLVDELTALARDVRIVITTSRNDDAVLHAAGRSQIKGLIWKDADFQGQLTKAVSAVLGGQSYFPPAVLVARQSLSRDPGAFFKMLSPREIEFATCFGLGRSDEEAARQLGVSSYAARSQRQRIREKLGLHSNAALIHWAIRTGIVDLGVFQRKSEPR